MKSKININREHWSKRH